MMHSRHSTRPSPARQSLRAQLRASRRSLRPGQQQHAAHQLAHRLATLANVSRWRHVALYWPDDGEIDPSVFARQLRQRGVRLYLPVIATRKGQWRLRFLAAPAQAYATVHRHHLRKQRWPAKRNRFGLREPIGRGVMPLERLDALLIPLVGFDAAGQRLGMGGGYYDRLLAAVRGRVRRPQLIGLAHQCQRVSALAVAAWDEPVDCIVTDQQIWPALRPRS